MSKIIKTISILLLFGMLIFSTVEASSQVNMNLANNNASLNQTTANSSSTNNVSSKTSSLTNTSAIITSVNELDDTSAGFGASEIFDILLIAVGFVIILLAIAILIRLKK